MLEKMNMSDGVAVLMVNNHTENETKLIGFCNIALYGDHCKVFSDYTMFRIYDSYEDAKADNHACQRFVRVENSDKWYLNKLGN